MRGTFLSACAVTVRSSAVAQHRHRRCTAGSDRPPGPDGLLRYKWRGTDPNLYVKVAPREAIVLRLALIWFFGAGVALWQPIFPVYVLAEEPAQHQFVVDPVVARTLAPTGSVVEGRLRRYIIAEMKRRLHQPVFRPTVMRANGSRCALCSLRHAELLDAAHIVPDGVDGGEPVVRNGLAPCKIHHAAFDARIVGIRPDLRVEVRRDLLEDLEGPMLRYGIQGLPGGRLMVVPPARSERLDRQRLELAYDRFRGTPVAG